MPLLDLDFMRVRLPASAIAFAALASLGACVSSSTTPPAPSFDASADGYGGSSGSSGASSGGPDADAAPGTDGPIDAGDGSATEGGGPVTRVAYVTGVLRDLLPDGGPAPRGIFGFGVDPMTGVLSEVDLDAVTPGVQPYLPAGLIPIAAVATPDGRFLYVADVSSSNPAVYTFAVDTKTGALTAKGQTTAGITGDPYYLATDPAGKRLYVSLRSSAAIAVFDIGADGSLAAQAPGLATRVGPRGLVFSSAGDLLFVVAEYGESATSFKVDPTTGALSNPQTVSTPGAPIGVAHHTSKKVFYVLASTGSLAYAVSYDATGALTVLGSQPTGNTPLGGALSLDGAFLYVNNANNSTLYAYPLDPTTGALGAPIVNDLGTSQGPGRCMVLDPAGKVLVTGGDNRLAQGVMLGAGGTVTRVPSAAPPGTCGFRTPIILLQ